MVYEYECKCGEKSVRNFPIGKSPKQLVCRCGKRMDRVIHVPSIQFRGEGFVGGSWVFSKDDAKSH